MDILKFCTDPSEPWFILWNYPVSFIELIGTLTGLIAVWLAIKVNVITWPLSLLNVICFFVIFYKVHLYADAILQVYYFIVGIYGWMYWKSKSPEKLIHYLPSHTRFSLAISMIVTSLLFGYFMEGIHMMLPSLFDKPAAYPYIDGALAIASIFGTILLARGYIENWWIWIVVDIGSGILYIYKDIYLMSAEYFIFAIMAVKGWYDWRREKEKQKEKSLDMREER